MSDPDPIIKPSIPPGTSIGRYAVTRRLGQGGMGSVYEARHVDLGRRVAVKTLSRALSDNPDFIERFLREGRIAAQIEHPHVVGVTDVGTHEGIPFLVMEFLEGRDLGELLKDRGRLSVAQTIEILLPVIAALAVVHEAGLVHRDLKPGNVFLCSGAHGKVHPKLLDFGIAKPNREESFTLTKSVEILGTPLYMAPEQIRNPREIDARADVYSLGIILYECVTGELPFEIENTSLFDLLATIVAGKIRKPRSLVPELSEAFEAVVLQAMAADRRDRFRSVGELGAALMPFAPPTLRGVWEGVFASQKASFVDTVASKPELKLQEADRIVTRPSDRPAPEPPVQAGSAPKSPATPASGRSRAILFAAALVGIGGVGAVAMAWRSGATAATPTPSSATPSAATSLPPSASATAGPTAPTAPSSAPAVSEVPTDSPHASVTGVVKRGPAPAGSRGLATPPSSPPSAQATIRPAPSAGHYVVE
jgi:serine/threonine-protein kinase